MRKTRAAQACLLALALVLSTYAAAPAVAATSSPGTGTALLFRHANGTLALVAMRGSSPLISNPDQRLYWIADVGTDWRIIGTGDFNNDGHGDLLWQRSDGL